MNWILFILRWFCHINDDKHVAAVFLDLSKAFDLVPHDILLTKLYRYNCSLSSLQWFQSYLENRKQIVTVEDKMSSTKQIYSGVPQGSILAPLLFKIFINDLPHQIQYSQTDLYADDCTLTAVGNTLTEIETNLNNDLKNIETWCQINKMKINPSKSKCMILATNQKRRTLPNDNLTPYVSNEKLTNVPTHKLLGVIIDC